MKKLMFVFAVTLAAGFAQAATVDWSTGKINSPGDDGSGYSSSLISGSGYAATIAFFTYDSVNNKYEDYAVSSGTSSSTVNMNALKGTTSDDFNTSGTYYAQLVVTYGESTLTSEIAAFTVDTASSDPNVKLTFNTGSGFTSSGDKFPTAGWSGGSTDVPEPTSGLLLILGGAMLALRRRR